MRCFYYPHQFCMCAIFFLLIALACGLINVFSLRSSFTTSSSTWFQQTIQFASSASSTSNTNTNGATSDEFVARIKRSTSKRVASNKQQRNETAIAMADAAVVKNKSINDRAQRLLLLAESIAVANSLKSKQKNNLRSLLTEQRQPSGSYLKAVRLSSRDSLSSLLEYNSRNGDWRDYNNTNNNVFHVAIVFGKRLMNGRVTVEYASRIRTLVKLLKRKPLPFRPSVIFFCGDTRMRSFLVSSSSTSEDTNTVTNVADAGLIFFRQLCIQNNINIEYIPIVIDNTSNNENEVVQFVTTVVKKYIPGWFEQAGVTDTVLNQTTVVKIHFTFISNEYHLCNFNNVYHRSPQQSCMIPIAKLQEAVTKSLTAVNRRAFLENYYYNDGRAKNQYKADFNYFPSSEEYEDECEDDICFYTGDEMEERQDDETAFFLCDDFDDDDKCLIWGQTPRFMRQGALETSWSFQYAIYPYIQSKDEEVAFLGTIYLLGEELVPLLVNIRGIVRKTEFFQQDNYLMLASMRRSIVLHVEDLYQSRRLLRKLLNSYYVQTSLLLSPGSITKTRPVEVILESALHSLGQCLDLVRPAGLFLSTVSKSDWVKALDALVHSLSEIRNACDPDRPLPEIPFLLDD